MRLWGLQLQEYSEMHQNMGFLQLVQTWFTDMTKALPHSVICFGAYLWTFNWTNAYLHPVSPIKPMKFLPLHAEAEEVANMNAICEPARTRMSKKLEDQRRRALLFFVV